MALIFKNKTRRKPSEGDRVVTVIETPYYQIGAEGTLFRTGGKFVTGGGYFVLFDKGVYKMKSGHHPGGLPIWWCPENHVKCIPLEKTK